jgi:hypothetical protein
MNVVTRMMMGWVLAWVVRLEGGDKGLVDEEVVLRDSFHHMMQSGTDEEDLLGDNHTDRKASGAVEGNFREAAGDGNRDDWRTDCGEGGDIPDRKADNLEDVHTAQGVDDIPSMAQNGVAYDGDVLVEEKAGSHLALVPFHLHSLVMRDAPLLLPRLVLIEGQNSLTLLPSSKRDINYCVIFSSSEKFRTMTTRCLFFSFGTLSKHVPANVCGSKKRLPKGSKQV